MAWAAQLDALGQMVEVVLKGERFADNAAGVTPEDWLVLRLLTGEERTG